MKLLDARGLSCPEPVILIRRALAGEGGDICQVLVDNQTARENDTRYAQHQGYQVSVTQQGAPLPSPSPSSMVYIATCYSHFSIMRFKKRCDGLGIWARLMPVPRDLSSSCGTCAQYRGTTPALAAPGRRTPSRWCWLGRGLSALLRTYQDCRGTKDKASNTTN